MGSNSIKMSIELEGDKALRTLKALQKGVTKFGNEGGSGVRKVNSAFSNYLGTLGAIGTSKAIAVMSQQIRAAVSNAIDFEKSVAEINTLLPKNEKLTKKTTQAFLEFSSSFGKSAQTETRAFYQIVSAGVKGTAKQLDVLNQSNEAAIAGLVDVNTAADVLTSTMNAYSQSGLTAKESSDALFVAVREGKTTFGELAASIGQVAPTANAAGLEFTELTGTLAAITKNGISTAEATTGLKAILRSIIKPSQEAAVAAKQLGIEYSIAGLQKAGSFVKFLEKVKVATKGNIQTLARLIPNVRGLGPAAGIVTGDLEGFKEVLDATANSAGATAKAADIMKQSLSFKLDVAKESVNNLGITLIGSLAPQIKLVSSFWANAIKGFNEPAPTRTIEELETKIKKLDESTDKLSKTLSDNKNSTFFNSIFGAAGDTKRHLAEQLEALTKLKEERKKIVDENKAIEDAAAADKLDKTQKTSQLEVEIEKEKFNVLNEVRAENKAFNKELQAIEEEEKLAKSELDLETLASILGREQAIRELAKIEEVNGEAKQIAALDKLRDKALKIRTKKEQDAAKAKLAFERMMAQQGISLVANTGNLINAIAGKQTQAGFLLAKVAAVGNVLLADGQARASATAAAAAASIAAGPAAPAAFTANLAFMQGLITANTAVSLGTIAAQVITGGKFASGGIVGSSSQVNDRNIIGVNGGEAILNKRQQTNLFNSIDNGSFGGGGSTVITINNPVLLNDEGVDDLIDAINDAQEFRNKELRAS